jgi:hypothetical protein
MMMFYNLNNKLITLSLTTLLLTACGSENISSAPSVALDRSSDYPTDELTLYVFVYGIADNELSVSASVQNTSAKNLRLSGLDKLTVSVDGTETDVSYNSGVYHTASIQHSTIINELSATFKRNNALIASESISKLPLPFTPTPSYSNETIALNWAPEDNVSYKLLGQTLVCSNGQSYYRQEALPDLDGLPKDISSGQYSATLNTVFGASEAQLVAGYDQCQVDMTITAKLPGVLPTAQGGNNITLETGLKRYVVFTLK